MKTIRSEFNFLEALFDYIVITGIILLVIFREVKVIDKLMQTFSRFKFHIFKKKENPTSFTEFMFPKIRYVASLLSLLIFFYILICHFFGFIEPIRPYIDYKMFQLNYLRIILLLGLSLGIVAWVAAINEHKIEPILRVNYSSEENICYMLTAFQLTVFYISSLSFLGFLIYPTFVVLAILMYFTVTQLVKTFSII